MAHEPHLRDRPSLERAWLDYLNPRAFSDNAHVRHRDKINRPFLNGWSHWVGRTFAEPIGDRLWTAPHFECDRAGAWAARVVMAITDWGPDSLRFAGLIVATIVHIVVTALLEIPAYGFALCLFVILLLGYLIWQAGLKIRECWRNNVSNYYVVQRLEKENESLRAKVRGLRIQLGEDEADADLRGPDDYSALAPSPQPSPTFDMRKSLDHLQTDLVDGRVYAREEQSPAAAAPRLRADSERDAPIPAAGGPHLTLAPHAAGASAQAAASAVNLSRDAHEPALPLAAAGPPRLTPAPQAAGASAQAAASAVNLFHGISEEYGSFARSSELPPPNGVAAL